MKAALQLKMGQSLAMTPQLQQAIRLLQLSTLELHTEIQQALESNPLLEREENESLPEEPNHANDTNNSTQENEPAHVSATELSDIDSGNIPADMPTDSQWEDTFTSLPQNMSTAAPTDQSFQFDDKDETDDSLQAHLIWQMELTPFTLHERHIATALIDSIDEGGYLTTELSEIQQGLPPNGDEPTELDEIEAVLHRIQHFDPIGIGARNLSECLLIQLQLYPEDTPHLEQARALAEHHLEHLAKHELPLIKRNLKVDDDTLADIVTMIQLLNPRPGSQIETTRTEYIIPDIYVSKSEGEWQLQLNSEFAPKLTIAEHYAQLITRGKNTEENNYLKTNLQEARFFLKSLESRNDTLLKVSAAIIQRQSKFLEEGEEAMQPLVLHEIADEVDMHESTISRVTTRKYLHTPRGIFELKYFFSSHVGTDDGAGCSATAIRSMIKTLIEAENVKKPLSDNKITDMLQAQGIQVARRTVAKYREALNIPSSSERKRLF